MNPYVGLWSRLDRFQPEKLATLLDERRVVRIVVMRATIHLVTADNCLLLRPLVQPVLDAELARHPEFGPVIEGVDLGPVLAFAATLLAERPHNGKALRSALWQRFPDHGAAALAYACRNRLALVQVPPRGLWGRSAQVTSTTAESWLGRPLVTDPSIDDVVLRYLAAFGPASVADVAYWSRLTGLGEVVERLGPRLRSSADERGRRLVDLPDAPRPDPDVAAPPRFLPEYDNVLLSHADRSRFVTEENRKRLFAAAGPVHGSVLFEGSLLGTWWTDRDAPGGRPALVVRHIGKLTSRARHALSGEGRRFLRFLVADAETHDDVRLVALD